MHKFTLTIYFLLIAIVSYAQTSVSGGIFEDTQWTSANSPYLVTGDVVVFEEVTLTIDPGVEVLVTPGVTIEIRNGYLALNGTLDDPISIAGDVQDDNREHWEGFLVSATVTLNQAKPQVNATFCQFSNAKLLFDLDLAYDQYKFWHCEFTDNSLVGGDVGSFNDAQFEYCVFQNNDQGLECGGSTSRAYVEYCSFKNNGIGIEGGSVSNSTFTGHTDHAVYMYISLVNCHIWDNEIGVISDNHANTTVRDNYIHDNGVGVQIDRFWNEAGIVFAGNRICDNSEWNIDYRYGNAADLTQNCWCLDEEVDIKATIKDAYMDIALGPISVDATYSNCNYISGLPQPDSPAEPEPLVQVYPNPTKGETNIELIGSVSGAYFEIINTVGRRVSAGTGTVKVDFSAVPSGLYVLTVYEPDRSYVHRRKIVVQ